MDSKYQFSLHNESNVLNQEHFNQQKHMPNNERGDDVGDAIQAAFGAEVKLCICKLSLSNHH